MWLRRLQKHFISVNVFHFFIGFVLSCHFQKQLDSSSVQTKLSGFSFAEPSSPPLFCFLAPLAQTISTDQLKNITETFEMKWRKQNDIQLVDHIAVNSVFGDSGRYMKTIWKRSCKRGYFLSGSPKTISLSVTPVSCKRGLILVRSVFTHSCIQGSPDKFALCKWGLCHSGNAFSRVNSQPSWTNINTLRICTLA